MNNIVLFIVSFLGATSVHYAEGQQYRALPVVAQHGIFIPLNDTRSNNYNNNYSRDGYNKNNNYSRDGYNRNNNNNNNNYNRDGYNKNNDFSRDSYNRNVNYSNSYNNGNGNYTTNYSATNKYNSNAKKEMIYGSRNHGDVVLFNTIISKPFTYGWFRSFVSKDIVFPDSNSKRRVDRITSIVVTDNTKNGNGGHTQIMKGGVNFPNVKLRFIGETDKPIDLSLVIYGYDG